MPFSLESITIYPIKSCSGIALQESRMEVRGLQYDRRFMVVDENGTFVTQRKYPRMALIATSIEGDELCLHAPDMLPLRVLLQPSNAGRVLVGVWASLCLAMPVSSEADAWFSAYLGAALRLVYMPDETLRPVNPKYSINQNIVSFADGYPCMIAGAASLADLNQRMETPLPMNRFRPNLVVAGAQPFAEERWKRIQIGPLTLHATKGCVRCMIPMIDQEKGAITSKEPLRTLARYHMKERQITFGLQVLPLVYGQEPVRVGDSVEIIELAGL